MKERSPPMTPPPPIPRAKRNQRHNHAVKSECLPLDQAAKIVSDVIGLWYKIHINLNLLLISH